MSASTMKLSSSSRVCAPRCLPVRHSVRSASSARSARQPCLVVCSSSSSDSSSSPVSGRRPLVASMALLFGASSSQPAQAGFFGPPIEEKYKADTLHIIESSGATIQLAKDDPSRAAAIQALRKEINTYVAAYRREDRVLGRPSFGNTYSALNAIAGHYNSFGTKTNLPKKRMDQVLTELDKAKEQVERDR
ncbi:hypothetical protein PPROV_000601600 [Pycnococcus provasolii]|uniref:Photosystem II 11 kDa protein n=1 Tax=Pycnococcus provasolii TaxID=41880 RepID=A0A830HKU2_9CHLO|nr:hypothetical protein PPROV_000601600 [Pycnococcus provasolii]